MERALSLVGLIVMMGIAYALSTNRAAIRWKTVAWGIGLQFVLALFVLPTIATIAVTSIGSRRKAALPQVD